jgi:Lysozyme-like
MLLLFVYVLFLGAQSIVSLFDFTTVTVEQKQASTISKKVKNLEPKIQAELKKYNLEQHSNLLLALIQQESRGEGNDPMQASESAGLKPNTIDNVDWSIQQGIKHFAAMVTYGTNKQVDFPTIIQSYNMGKGYIDFIAQNGGKHTEQLAKQFSEIQVKKEPAVYTCGGDTDNFRYPYCYGDFSYTTKVMAKYDALVEEKQVAQR